jgi:hypothetical protein
VLIVAFSHVLFLAVKLMGKHQLGRDLSDADIKSIITWLKTLTGEIPKDYIAEFKVPNEIPKPKWLAESASDRLFDQIVMIFAPAGGAH